MTNAIPSTVERAAISKAAEAESPLRSACGVAVESLWVAIDRFTKWLDRVGYDSYDPYDLWGTRYGLFARRLYYERNPVGLPLIAPIVALETLWPGLRGLFVEKQRFATADAQFLLAFLNLHQLASHSPPSAFPPLRSGERAGVRCSEIPQSTISWLTRAKDLANDLLRSSVPGYSGYCWGYPFDWQNNQGLWRKNTPYITCIPYCFEAFLGLHDATGAIRYLEIADSIARFIYEDLHDTKTGADAAAASYSPLDRSKVVNASAYRAFVLFEAAHRLNSPEYRDTARRNLNFVLQQQRSDGSWLYAADNPAEAFIDHFHTCFVLKNLVKINRRQREPAVRECIARGYEYYRRALFDGDDNPKSFAIRPRMEIVKLEMYNVAEAITLGVLLRQQIPEAFSLAQTLARRAGEQYQLKDGHFVTRVYCGGLKHTFPFLRWPQAQMFYAITNLLLATAEVQSPRPDEGTTTQGCHFP